MKEWEAREASRKPWVWTKEFPDAAMLQLGCLMRIADSLERLVELMDPAKRAAEEKRLQAKEITSKVNELLSRVYNSARNYLRQRGTDGRERDAVRAAAKAARLAVHSSTPRGDDSQYLEALSRAVDAFDPTTFDWQSICLTPLRRRNLDAVLARIRDEPPAEATDPRGIG